MGKIYENIKKECDKQGLTIQELEKRAEIGNGTVGRWRESKPRVDTLYKVAVVLDVSIRSLIGDAEIA